MFGVLKVNHSHKMIIPLVAAMLIISALACGGGTDPEPTEPPEEPPPTEEVAEEPTATATEVPTEPAGGNLDVVNKSGDAICFVYISPAGSGDWGDDQLGAENVIEAGGSHTITDIPPGVYDIRVDDCNNETIYQQEGSKLGATDFTLSVTGGGKPGAEGEGNNLIIENTSGLELCYVYIALPDDDTWGDNQLDAGETVPSGLNYTIWGIPSGTYDLRVETCQSDPNDRQNAERTGVDLSRDFTWTIEPGEPPEAELVLVNKSGILICALFIALPEDETWGQNQLPEGTLVRTGTTFTITGIPAGTYDLRVESCDATPLFAENFGITLEDTFTWTIN